MSGTLTLRRLMVWAQDPLERMRLMAVLTDSVGGLRGGALASAVHAHVRHGTLRRGDLLNGLFIYLYGFQRSMPIVRRGTLRRHGEQIYYMVYLYGFYIYI